MAEKPFRVVIAGGSIAGLTLALALEKNGIDFLVLEAYPEIAPQKGASIAVLPNGFRILDQLGCYEDILAKVDRTTDNFIIRDSNGKVLIHVKDLEHHLIQRYVNVLRNLRLDARLKGCEIADMATRWYSLSDEWSSKCSMNTSVRNTKF